MRSKNLDFKVAYFYIKNFTPVTAKGAEILGDLVTDGSLERGISVIDKETGKYLFSTLIKKNNCRRLF